MTTKLDKQVHTEELNHLRLKKRYDFSTKAMVTKFEQ